MHYLRRERKQPANDFSVIPGMPIEKRCGSCLKKIILTLSHLLPSKCIPANVLEEWMLFDLEENSISKINHVYTIKYLNRISMKEGSMKGYFQHHQNTSEAPSDPKR